jgi:hypothetical protein
VSIPSSLTKVTLFSKIIAVFVFSLFILGSFQIGVRFGEKNNLSLSQSSPELATNLSKTSLSNDLLETIIKSKFPNTSIYFDRNGKFLGSIETSLALENGTGKLVQYVTLSQVEYNVPVGSEAYLLFADCYKVIENKQIFSVGQFKAKKNERITDLHLDEKSCQPRQ